MYEILMFIISLLLVLGSSYLLTCLIKSEKLVNSMIYLILIVISQLIISVEILSLIKQINSIWLLGVNFIVFITAFSYWKSKKSALIDFQPIKTAKIQIINSIKSDKALRLLFIFFCTSALISLILGFIVPSNSTDGLEYHLARIGFWMQHQTLAHFETCSLRQIAFPINSEIIILWLMIFFKKDYLAFLYEYSAYWGCILVLWGYLSYFRVSVKRRLWTILILASLPAFIIEASSAQTNLIIAFLLLSSLYLFIYGVRERKKKDLIFSAVAYSVALGTKSTAFLFLPVLGLIYLFVSIREYRKLFYKPLTVFVLAFIPAFLILSSYNYILNYIDFANVFGPELFIRKHNAPVTLNNFLASLIRYSLLFVNFTGFSLGNLLSPEVIGLKNSLFHLFSLKPADGLLYEDFTKVNVAIHENHAMFGPLGFLLVIPLIFRYSFPNIFSRRNRTFYLSIIGLIGIGFLLSISVLMGFCYWYNRFFLSAVVLVSPILALSYSRRKNAFKTIIVFLAIFNYIFITNFNASKPTFWVYRALRQYGFEQMREEVRLREDGILREKSSYYDLIKYLGKTIPDNAKIGLIFTCEDSFYPFFEKNPKWKIYSIRYELLKKNKNYDDYDYLIFSGKGQYSDIFHKGKLKYNYTIKNRQIIYVSPKPDESITLYIDKDGNPVNSGNPIIAYNIIDFSRIPNNFRLINSIVPNRSNQFFIYKKIGQS